MDGGGECVELAVKSELLCFVADKSKTMAVDDLVKVTFDFYQEVEVIEARTVLEGNGIRMPKRKGNEKIKSTLEDIARVMLDPANTLPTFYAVNLARLPPVDAKHCDVAAILIELQFLRREIRQYETLKTDFDALRDQVQQLTSGHQQLFRTQNTITGGGSRAAATMTGNHAAAAISLKAIQEEEMKLADMEDSRPTSFATLASHLPVGGLSFKDPRRPRKSVVGAGSKSNRIVVATRRNVDLFVTRLSPDATEDDVKDCVMEALSNDISISVNDLTCTKLVSKFENFYSSYYVQISVLSNKVPEILSMVMSADTWPQGLLVRRYFKPKNKND